MGDRTGRGWEGRIEANATSWLNCRIGTIPKDPSTSKLGAGLVLGTASGWLVGFIIYHLPAGTSLSRTADGFIALGVTLIVYTATEFAHGYGFLAVFVAGLMIRRAAQGPCALLGHRFTVAAWEPILSRERPNNRQSSARCTCLKTNGLV